MKLLAIDFESYYDKEYSLSKMTTEEYVRDPRFETIGVSVKVDDSEPEWASGTHEQLKAWLQQFPWADSIALAHNAMFDGAILNWHFGLRPKFWVDTLGMGRAIHGVEVGGSLAQLAERYKIGEKGNAVLNAMGVHRVEFSAEELSRYGDYCINDTDLTYKLFDKMLHNGFQISLTTGKDTWAFAKSDEEFKALLEHPDEQVQAIVAARLGAKSTLEESRTERFIGIAKRGAMPVPLKYYAAHTGRWGGLDKLNLQNLPSRTADAGKLKRAIIAPEGYAVIDCDSSQIEARVLAWLAGQQDVVDAFAKREDVYKKMAARIYDKAEDDVTKEERFIGKTTILGAGYGMGAPKFQAAIEDVWGRRSLDECRRIISAYRETNDAIVALWRQAQTVLVAMSQGVHTQLGREGVLELVPEEYAIKLPNGLLLRYADLSAEAGEKGLQYSYKTRQGRVKIYGGKVVENVVQALARIVVGEQMVRVAKKYRVVLTVHDAVACIAPQEEAGQGRAYVEECMRWVPAWALGLPVNCESGVGKSYGEC
jgi:hypothetical protein